MGVQLQSGGGSSRGLAGGRSRAYRPMAEINVTPFVDVMLVLLVVFMITAPLLTAGVPVDLPDSEAKPIIDNDNKPLEVSVIADGVIYIGETEVKRERLISLLTAMTKNDPDRPIYVRGDKDITYGKVMDVLGSINAAGFNKAVLVTNSPKK